MKFDRSVKYMVEWSDEDEEWVGTCDNFPSLSWLAATRSEAMAGIMRLVAECIEDQEKKNNAH